MATEITFNNFVGIFDNAFSDSYCDRVIKYFDDMNRSGFGKDRLAQDRAIKHAKDDVAVFAHDEGVVTELPMLGLSIEFADMFWHEHYPEYAKKFTILNDYDKHGIYTYKIQKTEIGGGYHIWHSEDSARSVCGRVLVWMLYLNDVEEGGETEFLYYPMRVKAKKGRLIIWPAGFTHTHRGNPPISNEKYVVTGWVEL